MKKKAFTLIELIAVLVILAILALIVTPLVMNIIRKARIAADMRSIDAYGRSVELAIANYLLDNGDFPDSINDLQIEYTGDEVVCSTAQLNSDSSVYLSGCTVGGRTVDYTYGTDNTPSATTYTAYSVGDEVTYNNVNYYVISDSDKNESAVTLLKAEPLTVAEVNQYGEGHVNMYDFGASNSSSQTARNINGYGGIAFYSSSSCRTGYDREGCISNYDDSEIKYVVDAWAMLNTKENDLIEDETGYSSRLITINDLVDNLGYEYNEGTTSIWYTRSDDTPNWVYNSSYTYWTMDSCANNSQNVYVVGINNILGSDTIVSSDYEVLRPVITIKKSALQS